MAHSTLFALVALTSLTYVAGQSAAVPTFPQTPLVSLHFPYSSMPYQAVPQTYVRGTQFGYNQCNSSTENQNSLCQDIFVNGISDFCFFAPPKPNSTISDTEAEEVSWCSKKGHGTRGIPPGTITGIQVLVNSNYIQYVAHIKQENVNVASGDFGGELDSGGQDELGNPMGGLCYSTAFSSDNTTYEQIASWNVFLGGNLMGMKICNPSGSNPAGYCQHTLDRIGLAYNMPNNAQDGVFEVCDTDPMDIPGVYTSGGQTLSYAQPPESLGAITSIPYTPRIPASSNCQTYQSSALYTDFLNVATNTASGAKATITGNGSGSSGTRSGSSALASATSGSNGAGAITISVFSSILGVAFSIAFLA